GAAGDRADERAAAGERTAALDHARARPGGREACLFGPIAEGALARLEVEADRLRAAPGERAGDRARGLRRPRHQRAAEERAAEARGEAKALEVAISLEDERARCGDGERFEERVARGALRLGVERANAREIGRAHGPDARWGLRELPRVTLVALARGAVHDVA